MISKGILLFFERSHQEKDFGSTLMANAKEDDGSEKNNLILKRLLLLKHLTNGSVVFFPHSFFVGSRGQRTTICLTESCIRGMNILLKISWNKTGVIKSKECSYRNYFTPFSSDGWTSSCHCKMSHGEELKIRGGGSSNMVGTTCHTWLRKG